MNYVIILLLLLVGCATRDADIIAMHYETADGLMVRAEPHLDRSRPILVAPFLEVGDLSRSTDFGSLAADQMASRFAQQGYQVLDMKLDWRTFYAMQGHGRQLLSDELRNLSLSQGAQAVLLGTYAVAEEHVYVSTRLVRVADNVMLATGDLALPLGPDTVALTRGTEGALLVPGRSGRLW